MRVSICTKIGVVHTMISTAQLQTIRSGRVKGNVLKSPQMSAIDVKKHTDDHARRSA